MYLKPKRPRQMHSFEKFLICTKEFLYKFAKISTQSFFTVL